MADVGRFIGKFATGVAQVAVPAALESHRGEIQKQRDARLQEYAKENQKAAQTFAREERYGSQGFTDMQRLGREAFEREQSRPQFELNQALVSTTQQYLEESDPAKREKLAQDIKALAGRPETQADRLAAQSRVTDSRTTDEKNIAAMVRNGVFESETDAWQWYQRTENASSIARVFQGLQQAQEEGLYSPDDPEWRSPQQMWETARSIVGTEPGNQQQWSPEQLAVAEKYRAGDLSYDEAMSQIKALDQQTGAGPGGADAQRTPVPDIAPTMSTEGAPPPPEGPSAEDEQAPRFNVAPPSLGEDASIIERVRAVGDRFAKAGGAVEEFLDENIPSRRKYKESRKGLGRGDVLANGTEPGATQANPVRPMSQAEVSALPEGTWYVDPDTGEIQRKPTQTA